jgi:hypothetical protein
VSNHSYGLVTGWYSNETEHIWEWYGDLNISTNESPWFGLYSSYATNIDGVAYVARYHLPVWSAGNDRNEGPVSQPVYHKAWRAGVGWEYGTFVHEDDGGADGYDCIAHYQLAKNVLTVGAVNDIVGGYASSNDVVITSFSCFGPTDDGRLKPDLTANGYSLYTPTAVAWPTQYYGSLSGTSQAAPNTSGSLGLLQQLQAELYGTNVPFLASTFKALLIHTADEAGTALGPDYRFGWGLVNTLHAAQLLTNNAAWESKPHVKEVLLPDQDYVEFQILSDGTTPIRVTICWTDPPGPEHSYQLDPTNLVLVNDLDLRVVSPSSVTNFPWVLDPTNPSDAATTGDNFRDNVEQVCINSPTSGLYTVLITHKGNLTNTINDVMSQDVSIIITGNIPTNAPDLEISDYVLTTSSLHKVEWPSVVGSIYQIQDLDNLAGTNSWTATDDDISATKQIMSWSDTANTGTVDSLKFYRIQQVQ